MFTFKSTVVHYNSILSFSFMHLAGSICEIDTYYTNIISNLIE